MSHTVLRGKPSAAQLHLDSVLDEVLVSRGVIPDAGKRGNVSLPQILFYCLEKYSESVFMINGATGVKTTNGEILKRAIPLARTLVSEGVRGKVVILVMVTDENTVAVYHALLFAGAVPLFLFPSNTVVEISHFLKLLEPYMVFCDERYYDGVMAALKDLPELQPKIVVPHIMHEPLGVQNINSFQIPDVNMDETVMLVPTSGSTGLPKACLMTHRGFVAKLASPWNHSSEFPTPTALALLMSPPAEIVFHRMVTSCVVFNVPVLLPFDCRSEEWVEAALLTYRPTWAKFMPLFAKSLLSIITADHLSSMQCLLLSGSKPCDKTKAGFMDLLPKSAVLEEMYGMTEAHGVVARNVNGEPLRCTNNFEYKLLDDDGNSLGLCSTGELCIKGPALAKGYYRSSDKMLEDGWYKTGDLFYVDENENLFYLERKAVCFKYKYLHVSPEEVERVISAVPGVAECAVCLTARGVTAAVVARGVTREDVHNAVNGALSPHKRLDGGVGFASALPVSHTGKLDRKLCNSLIHRLAAAGECY